LHNLLSNLLKIQKARKITLDLGLTYDNTPINMQLAMDVLQKISKQNSHLDNTKTVTAFTEFGDFSLTLRYIYYIKKESDIFNTMTEVNMEILKQFNDNKFKFAFPTQTLYNIKG